MTVNLGVRFDFFNANKMVNYTVFDPAAMSEETDGNLGIGIISFDPEGEYAVKTKTQYAISPRIGIAHQITEGTVLHFMYGHFNQRPVWTQITQNAVIFNRPRDPEVEYPNITPFPDDIKWCYMGWLGKTGNPALEYQRMIQYEVGVDQNIADFLRLDATLYYKDGVNLTNVGWQQGAENYETAHRLEVMLYSDPNHPTKPVKGKQVGFTTFPINGGYLDVRGLELTLETIFMRHVNISAIYNISYSSSGRYGPYQIYKEHINDDGSTYKLGIDNYWTGEESIGEIWNPVHTLKVNAHFDTPVDFGPQLGFFRPLGDWIFNVYYQYASPQKFTYHSVQQGDFSTEPRNMSWKAHHKVNLRVAKGFMIGGIRAEIFADVYNLFNSKVLRLMSGDDLVRYMEYGELPTVNVSYQIEPGVTGQWSEVNEWGNYTMDLMPRQIFFGLGLTF
jgi:outer membrane receptor protein involved in Fe transport